MDTLRILALGFGIAVAAVACGDDTKNETSSSSSSSSSSTTTSSGTGGAGGEGGAGGSAAKLDVQSHTSTGDGFVVSSHVVLGDKEAVLVDGQIFTAEAQKVVDLIKTSGKTLTTVFLTHAHPDHYVGMDVIKTAFPGAKFVTTKAVLADYNAKAQPTFESLKGMMGDAIPDKIVALSEVPAGGITVDGHALKIVELPGKGESVVDAAIEITELNAVITGDLTYNKAHLWLAECNSQGWLANLEFIREKKYTTFYPGHGAKATDAVLDEDKAYIEQVEPILDKAKDATAAIAEIKAKFPDYTGDNLLSFGTSTYFASCK
jgi:glyoxylase-like metal-dependent hydrolase (beta-lactamase superfamily II)